MVLHYEAKDQKVKDRKNPSLELKTITAEEEAEHKMLDLEASLNLKNSGHIDALKELKSINLSNEKDVVESLSLGSLWQLDPVDQLEQPVSLSLSLSGALIWGN